MLSINALRILLWIPQNCYDCTPLQSFGEGNFVFEYRGCEYQNCYVTTMNNGQTNDYDDYDMLLFNGRTMISKPQIPKKRKPNQIYAFFSLESSARFPICDPIYDDFFNITITHRLNSDIPWPYFLIIDINNSVVAPKTETKWRNVYDDINWDQKQILQRKDKLAAWYVSNCDHVKNARNVYIRKLNKELARVANLSIDIYGKCGTLTCPKEDKVRCARLIEQHYVFYMAFENTSEEDYVTEKVYTALKNNVLPIVFGGANYTRFLPRASYINAANYDPQTLAWIMINMYKNRSKLEKYFRWKNHYRIRYNNRGIFCKLCKMLNEGTKRKSYKGFRKWWNSNHKCK